jgi:hypothetical protein
MGEVDELGSDSKIRTRGKDWPHSGLAISAWTLQTLRFTKGYTDAEWAICNDSQWVLQVVRQACF